MFVKLIVRSLKNFGDLLIRSFKSFCEILVLFNVFY